MRRYDYMGYTVEYPDACAYAFNPMEVRITVPQNSPVDKMGVGISDMGETVNIGIGAPVFRGVAVMDISDAVQTMFSVDSMSRLAEVETYKSPTSMMIKLTIALEGVIFTPKVMCVWGALQTDMGAMLRGDYNNDYNSDFTNLHVGMSGEPMWAYGKPFTLSLPAMAGDTIRYQADSEPGQTTLTTVAEDGIINVNVAKLVMDRDLIIAKNLDLYIFRGDWQKRLYTIKVDYQPGNKIYLRWIDKKGYYCYWPFDKVVDSYQSEKIGAFITNVNRSIDYVDGFNGGDGRQQGWKAQRSVGIMAPLVDEKTWIYLLGVMQSPIVDMYVEDDPTDKPRWIKVALEPGKVVRENAVLSDFSATLLLDQINNQRL